MSGPANFKREAFALDAMLERVGGPGWAGLEEKFAPAKVADRFDPGDDMKKVLAAFYNTMEGRRIIDWLADLTFRAPYPHVGASLESAALAAKAHEARCAVGESLLLAIAEGNQLLYPRQESQT